MADTATLQARLNEAEQALHAVLVGNKTVEIDYGDRKVRYDKTNVGELRAYIADLKTELGVTSRRRRAITVNF